MSFKSKLFDSYHKEDKNFMFSPYSIKMALYMILEGAKGNTKEEMQNVLGRKPEYIDDLNVANAVWLLAEPNEEWLSKVKEIYRSTSEDLTENPNPEDRINQWISKKTNGKINKIIKKIKKEHKMILTNAIYFMENWLHEFEETTKENFYIDNDEIIKVDMMSLKKNLRYTETLRAQVVELPYKNTRYSMTVILPKNREISKNILDKTFGFGEKKVDLYLPKFKFERKFSLKNDLKSIGIHRAFTDFAQFEIADDPLKIDDVIHKTYIEVDEKGTEAAAATGVVMRTLSSMAVSKPPIVMRVNRPFIFLIKDRYTNSVLFSGYVKNPSFLEV